MNAEKLIRAIGGISDKHIEEFSVVKPVFSTKTTWLEIASIAACIAILFSIVNIALNFITCKKRNSLMTLSGLHMLENIDSWSDHLDEYFLLAEN